MTFAELKSTIERNQPGADLDLIQLAYEFAADAHKGQKRMSGEPYIDHPLNTAKKLSELHLDQSTIIAGLLHDVPEDTEKTIDDIRENFGEEIAFLVEGITKLGTLKYRGMDRFAENLRKMFVAMAEDVRVVFIKFADRMHNLETLGSLPEVKQKRIAQETIEIYAPIAERLGIGKLKDALEDLAFPFAYPEEYEWLKSIASHKREKQAHIIKQVRKQINKFLADHGVKNFQIEGRVKRDFSLYKKLTRKEISGDINKIYDLNALRIIVPTVSDCYHVLGLIHECCKPISDRFKDYIAQPKPNGYQSLHTVVFTNTGEPVEFQIRTSEMHNQAEYGIAAHFNYKEYDKNKAPKIGKETEAWLNHLKKLHEEISENSQFLETLKLDIFSNRIFVFTPKGDVIDLPEDATAIDFAYHIHTEIGNKCGGAKINGKLTQLDEPLKSGDVIDIIIDKKRTGPTEDWLEIVKTHTARDKIKSSLRRQRQGIIDRLLNR